MGYKFYLSFFLFLYNYVCQGRERKMIVIRKFQSGSLTKITTWGCCDAFGYFLPRTLEQSIQINVMIDVKSREKIHTNLLGNGSTAYYLFTQEHNCQAAIDELLIKHRVVGMTQLLTNRELDVIKALFELRNTKKTATHLGISDSTLVNHQSNISRKIGFRSSEIAAMIADYSSAELLMSVISPTD